MNNQQFIARKAAQYFQKGDIINLGIGIPSFCKDYSVDSIMYHTEIGMISNGETTTIDGTSYFDSATSFAMIRSGRMSITVLEGLQVAENGDLANWDKFRRSYGMSGVMDLVIGCKKVIVVMEICTKDGKPRILNKCSLPLTGLKCVDHIVTEVCVIDVTDKGLVLKEIRLGYSPDDIQAKIEPKLLIDQKLKVMEE